MTHSDPPLSQVSYGDEVISRPPIRPFDRLEARENALTCGYSNHSQERDVPSTEKLTDHTGLRYLTRNDIITCDNGEPTERSGIRESHEMTVNNPSVAPISRPPTRPSVDFGQLRGNHSCPKCETLVPIQHGPEVGAMSKYQHAMYLRCPGCEKRGAYPKGGSAWQCRRCGAYGTDAWAFYNGEAVHADEGLRAMAALNGGVDITTLEAAG